MRKLLLFALLVLPTSLLQAATLVPGGRFPAWEVPFPEVSPSAVASLHAFLYTDAGEAALAQENDLNFLHFLDPSIEAHRELVGAFELPADFPARLESALKYSNEYQLLDLQKELLGAYRKNQAYQRAILAASARADSALAWLATGKMSVDELQAVAKELGAFSGKPQVSKKISIFVDASGNERRAKAMYSATRAAREMLGMDVSSWQGGDVDARPAKSAEMTVARSLARKLRRPAPRQDKIEQIRIAREFIVRAKEPAAQVLAINGMYSAQRAKIDPELRKAVSDAVGDINVRLTSEQSQALIMAYIAWQSNQIRQAVINKVKKAVVGFFKGVPDKPGTRPDEQRLLRQFAYGAGRHPIAAAVTALLGAAGAATTAYFAYSVLSALFLAGGAAVFGFYVAGKGLWRDHYVAGFFQTLLLASFFSAAAQSAPLSIFEWVGVGVGAYLAALQARWSYKTHHPVFGVAVNWALFYAAVRLLGL